MKTNKQWFNFNKVNAFVYIMSMFAFTTWAAVDTNSIPEEYINSHSVWGVATNEVRAGLAWSKEVRDQMILQDFVVMVLTSKTNAVFSYVKPPNEKFAKFELRDSKGALLVPRRGLALDGQMPETIQLADLPKTPKFGRNNPLLAGALHLFQNRPVPLKIFDIQDVYQVEAEGDYTLTVWPTIYQLSTNQQFVNRIDIMPVSMKVHLSPSQ